MENNMTQALAAACIGLAKTGVRLNGVTMTHEAFASLKAESYAPNGLVELHDGQYWFGALPITTVETLPADALNPHYVIQWTVYDET